jgi:uncharacterized protein (TIGR02996 family)
MALDHSTRELAARHRLSQGRISQLRREFHLDWRRYHGEAVCPGEDGPRLALADWLDDHGGHARAGFVRLQCRLSPGAAALDSKERAELESRCQGLIYRHGGAWLGPL